MSAAQLVASIRRHLPFLLPGEKELFDATPAEQRSIDRSREIARRMQVRLPGSAA